MTKAAIIRAIATSNLSVQELCEINQAVAEKHRLECALAGSNFSVGDRVTWSSKRGTFTGTLEKINRKNGKVRVGKGGFTSMWTVPMSMLQAA